MKKMILLIPIICLSLGNNLHAQNIKFGINPKLSNSTLFYNNPSRKEDGVSRYNYKIGWGLNAFIEKKIDNSISTLVKMGYSQKGFKIPCQTLDNDGYLIEEQNIHKFDYINIDILAKFQRYKHTINPYFQLGLRADYLKEIRYSEITIDLFPDTDFKKYDIGALVCFGANFSDIFWLDIEKNIDLLRPVKTDFLAVRNYVWTLNLGIYLDKVFKSKKG